MKTKPNEVIDEVLDYVDGHTYTTTNGLAKDIKELGYTVTEIVNGEYVAFKNKNDDSFLAFLSDKKPYFCFDVDTDITFTDDEGDDSEDDEKNTKKKDKNSRYDNTYSVNYGKGYQY